MVQHRVQLRSSAPLQEAIKHLRDRLIGNIYMARGLFYKWRPDIGDISLESCPEKITSAGGKFLWDDAKEKEGNKIRSSSMDDKFRRRRGYW